MADLDELSIKITSDASRAASGIDSLIKSFTGLKTALDGFSVNTQGLVKFSNALKGFSNVHIDSKIATQLSSLGTAARSINDSTGQKVSKFATGLSSFSGIKIPNVNGLANGLIKLPQAASNLKSVDFGNLKGNIEELSGSLGSLNGVSQNGISGVVSALRQLPMVAASLENVNFEGFTKSIGELAPALSILGAVPSTSVSTVVSSLSKLPVLASSLGGLNFGSFTASIQQLVNGMSQLAVIPKTGLGSVIGQLAKLPAVASQLNGMNFASFTSSIQTLVSGMSSLSGIPKTSLGSIIAQLQKLPALSATLQTFDFSGFADSIQQAAAALQPLITQVNQLSGSLGNIPSRLSAVSAASKSLGAGTKSGNVGLTGMLTSLRGAVGRFMAVSASIGIIGHTLGAAVTQANGYIENLNLFTVSMGEYADEAQQYAEKVSSVMGIDVSEWMRNQGIFMTLATGFGVASDRAYVMSQNLTQLGYDISSFFNIPFEEALEKLQAGMSGELEPLRRLGWDLSQTQLDAVAASLGIDQATASMTQAEKAEIRYYTIMNQVTTAQGDLGRTLVNPANQLRILTASATMAARALGNIFIPMLNAVLPVAIAVMNVIRALANTIASFFGFSIPEVDYSSLVSGAGAADDLSSGLDDVSDSANGATGAVGDTAAAVEDLYNEIGGFDELNVIKPPTEDAGGSGGGGGGGGAGVGGAGGSGFDFKLPTYDFFTGELEKSIGEWEKKIKKFAKVATPIIAGIAAGFAGWKLTGFIFDLMKSLEKMGVLGKHSKILGKAFSSWNRMSFGKALVPTIALVAFMVARFVQLLETSEAFRDGLSTIFDWLTNIDDIAETVVGWFSDGIDSIAGWAEGLLEASGILEDIQPILDAVGPVVEDIKDAVGEVIDALDLDALDVGITTFGVVLTSMKSPLGKALLAFEGITLAIRAIGFLSEPAVEQVDLLGGVSETTAEKLGTALDSLSGLDEEITKLDWSDVVITEDDVTKVEGYTQDIHDQTVENINSIEPDTKESLDSMVEKLNSIGDVDLATKLGNVEGDMTTFYDNMRKDADDGQARINEIYETAAADHRSISDSEAAEIKSIRATMGNDLLVSAGATASEISSINQNMANNQTALAVSAASTLIQQAAQARDSQISDAQETKDQVYAAAAQMYGVGTPEYAQMTATADEAYNAMVTDANTTYDQIYNDTVSGLGESAKYIDAETGQVKTNWDLFTEGITSSPVFQWIVNNLGTILPILGLLAAAITAAAIAQGIYNAVTYAWPGTWIIMAIAALIGIVILLVTHWDEVCEAVAGAWQAIVDAFGAAAEWLDTNVVQPVITFLLGLWNTAGNLFATLWDLVCGIWDAAGKWFEDNVTKPVAGFFTDMWDGITGAISDAWLFLCQVWSAASTWISDNVTGPMAEGFAAFFDAIGKGITAPVNLILSGIEWLINKAIDAINVFIDGINTPANAINAATNAGLPTIGRISAVTLPRLASGGIVDAGTVFLAGEAGPEIVGSYGSKSAVLNNNQIVASVTNGVMNANQESNALLREQNAILMQLLLKDTTLVMDHETVAKTINKANRVSGRTGSIVTAI